ESDPAGVKVASDLAGVMSAMSAAQAPFVSRGDDSGTHRKELKLWEVADIAAPTPGAQDWYESAGQGMGEVLTIASNKGAYTIADRATYLSMRDALDLVIVREGDKNLLNQYGVIVVTDAANQDGGQAFFDWILSLEGQKVIEEYGVQEYGEPLFIPNAK
ncbi:MAG: ABC transporter substrate-binding protein, partial [Coriobacteriia bacterium]